MKRVVLTGGGSGGHIFPLLAVACELQRNYGESVKLFYLGPASPLNQEFVDRGILVRTVSGSKLRRYFSWANILEGPKFLLGIAQALLGLLLIMPDVVFSKGGPGAFAVVLMARLYRIPVVIHESDAVPGLTNRWSSRFAERIEVAFETAREYFPAEKTHFVGNPIRSELLQGIPDAGRAKRFLGFYPEEPLLLVLGGSQGAARLNTFILENLEEILGTVQVLHQVGPTNIPDPKEMGLGIEEKACLSMPTGRQAADRAQGRYRSSGFFSLGELRNALAAADVVFSRAGSGTISEIAAFGKPAILVPLPESAGDHQRRNAYEYAHCGGAMVFEEENMRVHLVLGEVCSLLGNKERREKMSEAASAFAKPGAAAAVARDIAALFSPRI